MTQSDYFEKLPERRPESVAKNALGREYLQFGQSRVFFSLLPEDPTAIEDVGFVYPNAGERDGTTRELVVRGSDANPAEAVIEFMRKNPAEFHGLERQNL